MSTHSPQPHHHETAPMHDAPDEWHDHSHDEMPQEAHSEVGNAHLVVGVGLGAFGLVVCAVIAIYGYYVLYTTGELNRRERQEGNLGEQVWTTVKEKQRDIEPAQAMWIDHDTVQLPLEVAVERVLADYKAGAERRQ